MYFDLKRVQKVIKQKMFEVFLSKMTKNKSKIVSITQGKLIISERTQKTGFITDQEQNVVTISYSAIGFIKKNTPLAKFATEHRYRLHFVPIKSWPCLTW